MQHMRISNFVYRVIVLTGSPYYSTVRNEQERNNRTRNHHDTQTASGHDVSFTSFRGKAIRVLLYNFLMLNTFSNQLKYGHQIYVMHMHRGFSYVFSE